MNTQISVEHINAELVRLGRSLAGAIVIRHFWVGDDYRMQLNWPDGFFASVGFGAEASMRIKYRLDSRAFH